MNFDLNSATVFLTLSGSRAYGFSSTSSDWDYRGIAIPPLDSYIGVFPKFEQAVDTDKNKHVWKNYPNGLVQPDSDMQVMELTKFCRLALDNNPSIIEILFSDSENVLIQHPVLRNLIDNRDLFLSRRVKARFCGYAYSQLSRIDRHKRWLDSPPEREPLREDFGLPKYGLISSDQIGAAKSIIEKETVKFVVDQTDLPEHTKIDLKNGLEHVAIYLESY